jgi:argininosuccinate synthase
MTVAFFHVDEPSTINYQHSVKIVLAYSGGLDTSIILRWLRETYDAEIIAFCADIGQEEELEGLDEKDLRTGATKSYIDELQEELLDVSLK